MSLRFSAAVERALAEVCPPTDAIDGPDFDAVAFINSRFPDEASLSGLGAFHAEITTRLRRTENELLKAVEAQATNSSSADKDLRDAKTSVAGLYSRVSDIKQTAAKSEDTVRELCQNIRQLDTAKTNLTTSINTLRNMQLWMMQLQTLATCFERRKYIQCRDALIEAQKYAQHFDRMKELPKVKELLDKQQQLSKQMEYYIRNSVFGDMSLAESDESVLAEACAVVDVLGKEAVKKIRDKFIDREMETYMNRFKRGSDDAKLERTERRYVFIRSLLEQLEPLLLNVFPKQWCVAQELCISFCLRTKSELDYLLREASGTIDVLVLTYVLQKTIDVERDLTQMLAWKEEFPGRNLLPDYRYNGLILSSFKAHMGLFVQNEDRLMCEALAQPFDESHFGVLVPLAATPGAGPAAVASILGGDENDSVTVGLTLPVAEDIFVFIKESLKRTIRISQQDVLVDMAAVWRKHLLRFCELTLGQLHTPAASHADMRRACIIINTADLCQTTSQALGEEVCVRSEVPPSEIDFEQVCTAFSSLYTQSIQAVVMGVEKNISSAIQEICSGAFMSRRTGGFADHEMEAQDESATVRSIRATLQDTTLVCAAVLPANILRFLLDKIAAAVIPQYNNCLYRMRRLTDLTINQLRVDSAALERGFLQLPNFNDPERYLPSMLSGYMKLVRREFDRLNRALKVLQVDATSDAFVDVYFELTLPEDRSIQHFVRIVELKGLRREDVRQWVTKLSKRGVVEATKRDMLREAAINAVSTAGAGGGTGININFGFGSGGGGGGVSSASAISAMFGSPTNTGGGASGGTNGFTAALNSIVGNGGGGMAGGVGGSSPPPHASAGAGGNASGTSDEGLSLGSRFAKVAQRTATSINFLNQFKKDGVPTAPFGKS